MNARKIPLLCLAVLVWGIPSFGNDMDISGPRGESFPARELEVKTEEVTLFTKIIGPQKAENVLIATNGGPGQSSRYMDSLGRLTGDNLALVTYDQRGTGRSTQPTGGYALLKYVQDLEAVRQAVGADQVHLLGHSWGGIVTLRYATVYPDRVRSLILMGSGPPSQHTAQEGQAKLGQRLASLQKQGIIPDSLPGDLASLLEAILPAYFSDPEFEIPGEISKSSFSQDVYQQTFSALGNWDFTQEVSKLTHPVLLCWGKDDPFGLPMAEAVKNSLSRAQVTFVTLEKCGHYWQECPDIFFAHIRAFLELEKF
jgi:proline iminopeptidase